MMIKKRSKIDIIVDALESAKKSTTKTNLILGLNIGWRKGENIFQLLVSKGLIKKIDPPYEYKRDRYVISQEGIKFIEYYNEITNKIEYEVFSRC